MSLPWWLCLSLVLLVIPCLLLALAAAPLDSARTFAIAADYNENAVTRFTVLRDECTYPDSSGLKAGDKVRIHAPAAKEHNSISVVRCPEEGASRDVCVLESTTCFPLEDVRTMSDVDLELVNLQARAEQFVKACEETSDQQWPVVQANLAAYAHMTRERLGLVSAEFLKAADYAFCEPEVRQEVRKTFTTIESYVTAMADVSARQWKHHHRPKLVAIAKLTAASVVTLGKLLANASYWSVKALLSSLRGTVRQITSGAVDQHPNLDAVAEQIDTFFYTVGELGAELVDIATDRYNSEEVQAALATVQAGTGELVAAAADKWPPVRRALRRFVRSRARTARELGLQALESVNLCRPEKRREVQAALAAVEARVTKLASAVAEHWPTVKGGILDLVESMSAIVNLVSKRLMTHVQDSLETGQVRDKLARIRTEVRQLQEITAQSATSAPAKAEAKSKAHALAERIAVDIQAVVRKLTGGESEGLIDKARIAELLPVVMSIA